VVRPHNLRCPYYEPLVWFMIVAVKTYFLLQSIMMGLLIGSGALSRCTAPIWGECILCAVGAERQTNKYTMNTFSKTISVNKQD